MLLRKVVHIGEMLGFIGRLPRGHEDGPDEPDRERERENDPHIDDDCVMRLKQGGRSWGKARVGCSA